MIRLASTDDVQTAADRLGIDTTELVAARAAFSDAWRDYSAFTGQTDEQTKTRARLVEACRVASVEVRELIDAVPQLQRTATDPYTRAVAAAMARLIDRAQEPLPTPGRGE